jgi:hypothetical protein
MMVCGLSAQSNIGTLLSLQQCATEVQAICQSVPIVDLGAVAECLQAHRDDISIACASVLEPFIHQEGQHGDLDQEVADQETSESASQIEAEDEICDAKFIASCKTEFFMAVYTHDKTALQECATQHATAVGAACLAMIQDGDADGLLSHMYHCGQMTLGTCPVEAIALTTETVLGLENVQSATLMALITCLKGETSALREGCSGFFNSVSEVVATYAAQASDQFRDEEDEQDIDPPPSTSGGGSTVVSNAPTPAPPVPTKPGKEAHPDQTDGDHMQKPHSGDDSSGSVDDSDDSDHKSFLVPGLLIALASVVAVALAAGGALFVYRRRFQNHTELVSMHVSMNDGPSQISSERESQGFIMGSGYSQV